MRTQLGIFVLFFMLPFAVFSQDGIYSAGARANALGNASVALPDHWSIFNNVGALGGSSGSSVLVSYLNRYQMGQGFQSIAAGYLHDFGDIKVGASAFQFGDQLFNENKIGLAYSHKINFVSLGVQVNRLQYSVEGFGTAATYVVELGGLVMVTSELHFGAYIYNINQANISSDLQEKVPTIMRAGFSYLPAESLLFTLQLTQDIDYNTSIQGGIEYAIIPELRFRTGVSTHPFINHFGLGFTPKKFEVDYSFINNDMLGMTHQLSLAFKFNQTDE